MSEHQNASAGTSVERPVTEVAQNGNGDGWLAQTIARGRRQLLMTFRPMDLVHRGQTVTLPVPPNERDDLFDDLNSHFYSWTGQTLRDYIRLDLDRRGK